MRFGVLGPLAVWAADGTPVRVPEAKVRALLADLLLHRGRVVSADRLIEDLWGERLPVDPGAALRGKVSQLRRALEAAEPGARGLVVFRSPGYLLHVEPDAVDADRFTGLVGRARGTTDPRSAAELLSAAAALWRGAALADFADAEFARPAVAGLEEQRLAALEEHVEARLALGEHGPLAGELADLVARHPLRERLRAAQLRALYRAGRQHEALAAYEELRVRLADELGVQPTPELVGLHRAILVQDPALDAAAVPERPRTNLPAPLTELIGRDDALAEVRALLGSRRLVTLTGPGGVGKTRLALAAAAALVGAFPDGVWLVDLTGASRPAAAGPRREPAEGIEVAELVMVALGVRDDVSGRPVPATPVERLTDAVRTSRMLVVLDNCEHVVEQVAPLVARLLAAAPGLRILATGQEPLGLTGEVLSVVRPLALPEPATDVGPEVVAPSGAVRLFATRAAAAAPGFRLDAGNIEAVVAICRRLDGLPLALELAAHRVRALGVQQLAARLDDRFGLLAAGPRDAPPRQQTLRATIDWSWELLTGAERVVLRRLAVVAETCTLAAAEEICAGVGVAAKDVLGLLARLVDRSLVVMREDADGPRYRLLESVAAYCLERLDEAGELDRVRRRHYRHYVTVAEQAQPHLRGSGQGRWLDRLDAESAELRLSLDRAVGDGAAEAALRLVAALAWYWYLRGRLTEGRRLLTEALAVEGGPPAARAAAGAWQVGFAILTATGADLAEQAADALAAYDDVEDPGGRAHAQWFLGSVQWGMGDPSVSQELVRSALAGFRAQGDRWGIAAALCTRAVQQRALGDLDAARRDSVRSVELFDELGDRWGRLQGIQNLAVHAEVTGDHDLAAGLHRDGLRMAEELGLRSEVSHQLSRLGRIALLAADLPRAEKLHERARRLAVAQSDTGAEHVAELGLALTARRQGKLDLAEAYLNAWLDWCRRLDGDPGTALILAELGFVAELRGDAEAAAALHLEGFTTARATRDPRAVALALEGLAGARAAAGRYEHAARLLGTAAATRSGVGAPLPQAERGDVDRISAATRAALGEDAFAAALRRGAELGPEDVIGAGPLAGHATPAP